MYTLKISDIKITPSITSEKELSNADKSSLVEEAVSLIEKDFPGVYPNPVTLERKITEVVKNAEGLTRQEVTDKEQGEINEQWRTETNMVTGAHEAIEKAFAEKMKQFNIERTEAIAAVGDIFDQTLTAEEREALELKHDDVVFEYKKKEDAMWTEFNEASKNVREALNLGK